MTPRATKLEPLESAELNVKLYVEDPSAVDLEELIPVFHRWIREGLLEGELPIDVAGYAHVPKGPGVVLICDHSHYYFDERAGRPGLRYRGRRIARGAGEERIPLAFRSVLRAAALLEKEPALGGRYRFRTSPIELGINDRLLAPSGSQTLAAVRPSVEAAIESIYGAPASSIELLSGPREPFMVSIGIPGAPSVDALLERHAAVAR